LYKVKHSSYIIFLALSSLVDFKVVSAVGHCKIDKVDQIYDGLQFAESQ